MLSSFFNPQSIVIIGASETPGKIGNSLLKNTKDFIGEVFAVNPKGGEYLGNTFYTTITDLPKIPEVAIIAIPAAYVKEALQQCGQKGISFAVIISAGFKEVGNLVLEKELLCIAKEHNIHILGPNCLGFLNAHNGLNASFGGKSVQPGNVALISQSGAMAVALMDWALQAHVGFSRIVSMGNKSDLDETNFLEYLENDNDTKIIIMYLESINAGRKFFEIAKRVTKKKPIILVKSGNSKMGSSAIASHTGALAGSKQVLETAFSQAGILYTDALENVFLWSEMFTKIGNKIESPQELIIITNAGGPGVMATDHAENNNVPLACFTEEEQLILKEGISPAASVKNPIDIIGDATSREYTQILLNIAKLKKNYALLILLTPQAVTDVDMIAKVIADYQIQYPSRIIFVSFMGGASVEAGRKFLKEQYVSHFDYPRDAITSFAKVLQQKKWESIPHIPSSYEGKMLSKEFQDNLQTLLTGVDGLVSPSISNQFLEKYNIPYAKEYIVNDIQNIEDVFCEMNAKKIAMKIVSKDIPHKTDCGGVILHINSLSSAQDAYGHILENVQKVHPNANIQGVSMQEMLPPSREVFLGFKRDESFGATIVFGLGGIFVNVLEDVAMAIAPLEKTEIQTLIEKIKAYPILKGVRGENSINFDALVNTIYKIQHLFLDFPMIKEIDVNPIFVNTEKSIVIDIKLYV